MLGIENNPIGNLRKTGKLNGSPNKPQAAAAVNNPHIVFNTAMLNKLVPSTKEESSEWN